MNVVWASYPVVPGSSGTHRKRPDNEHRAAAGHHTEPVLFVPSSVGGRFGHVATPPETQG